MVVVYQQMHCAVFSESVVNSQCSFIECTGIIEEDYIIQDVALTASDLLNVYTVNLQL